MSDGALGFVASLTAFPGNAWRENPGLQGRRGEQVGGQQPRASQVFPLCALASSALVTWLGQGGPRVLLIQNPDSWAPQACGIGMSENGRSDSAFVMNSPGKPDLKRSFRCARRQPNFLNTDEYPGPWEGEEWAQSHRHPCEGSSLRQPRPCFMLFAPHTAMVGPGCWAGLRAGDCGGLFHMHPLIYSCRTVMPLSQTR